MCDGEQEKGNRKRGNEGDFYPFALGRVILSSFGGQEVGFSVSFTLVLEIEEVGACFLDFLAGGVGMELSWLQRQ